MADLRGGSTVGGRPIATSDMIEKLISQEQIQDWTSKMNTFEKSPITALSSIDLFIQDATKNGIHQVSNIAPANGIYGFGALFNSSVTGYGFQIYSPETVGGTGATSGMYFRTRNNSLLRPWERVATYSYVDSLALLKFDKTGGVISGATTINALLTVTDLTVSNGLLTSTKNGNTVNIGSQNTSYCHLSNSANVPFHFNKDLRVAGEIYAGTGYRNRVWHDGNLTPSSYIAKSTLLSSGTDMNTLTTEGHYRGQNFSNRPDKISASHTYSYVEVIVHDSSWILQKIYDFNGTLAYMRTLTQNVWKSWTPLGGGMSYVLPVTSTAAWALDAGTGLYQLTVTHNLGSENIVSVILTDSAKMSMLTGFEVIDVNRLKVWCGENPTGKVVINATP